MSDPGGDLWRPEWARSILEKVYPGKGKNEALRYGGGMRCGWAFKAGKKLSEAQMNIFR